MQPRAGQWATQPPAHAVQFVHLPHASLAHRSLPPISARAGASGALLRRGTTGALSRAATAEFSASHVAAMTSALLSGPQPPGPYSAAATPVTSPTATPPPPLVPALPTRPASSPSAPAEPTSHAAAAADTASTTSAVGAHAQRAGGAGEEVAAAAAATSDAGAAGAAVPLTLAGGGLVAHSTRLSGTGACGRWAPPSLLHCVLCLHCSRAVCVVVLLRPSSGKAGRVVWLLPAPHGVAVQ